MHTHLSLASFLAALTVAAPLAAQSGVPAQRVNSTGSNLSPSNTTAGASLAKIPGGNWVAVWAEQFGTSDATKDIYAARSTDGATTWMTPVRIDIGDGANISDSEWPQIAVTPSNGAVHVIFEDNKAGFPLGSVNEDLYYARSVDGGQSWTSPAVPLNSLSSGSSVSTDIDETWIATDGLSVHVTWGEDTAANPGINRLFYRRSIDSGLTWGTPLQLSPVGSTFDVDASKIVAGLGTVIVAWIDDSLGDDDVKLRRSTNGGTSFSAVVNVETNTTGDADQVQMAMDGSSVILAWLDDEPAPGGNSVHAVVSTDAGATWSSEINLSPRVEANAGSQVFSFNVAVSEPDFYVAFSDDSASVQAGTGTGSSNADVQVSYSNDRGATWTFDQPIHLPFAGPGLNPFVIADTCGTWITFVLNASGFDHVGQGYSNTRGKTWGTGYTSSANADFLGASSSTPVALDPLQHRAITLYWRNATGISNELYSIGTSGCTFASLAYCTSGTSADGCTPTITSSGAPSATTLGFDLLLNNLPGQKTALIFYGASGRQATPWTGSNTYLCVKAPTQRMDAFNSGGTSSLCDGVISQDWSIYLATHNAVGEPLCPGEAVQAQGWYRDPASGKTTGLTNAREFLVQP